MFPISTSECKVPAEKTQMENTICLTVDNIDNLPYLFDCPVWINIKRNSCTVEMISTLQQIGAQKTRPGFWSSSGNLAQVTSQLVGVGYNVVTTTVVGDSVLVIMQLRSDLVTGPVNL